MSSTNYFLGANSYNGFYSLFNYYEDPKEINKLICLKGVPGNGKSSLMKNIGKHFDDLGYSIEYNHCSSDPDSLDGVVVKELKIGIIDGTAPHIVDPKNPLAVEKILDLSIIFNSSGIKKSKQNIIMKNAEIKNQFRRAYQYLKAAKAIHEDIEYFNNSTIDLDKVKSFKDYLRNNFFKTHNEKVVNGKHLFATAISPLGIVSYNKDLMVDLKNVYTLIGGPFSGFENILNFVEYECTTNGYERNIYHDPFNPNRIEAIVIKDLSFGIFSSNEINCSKLSGKQIYIKDFLHPTTSQELEKSKNSSEELFSSLLNSAIENLKSAKEKHDELEKFYIQNADFYKLRNITNNLISSMKL